MIKNSLKFSFFIFFYLLSSYILWGQLVIHGTTFSTDLNTNVKVDGHTIVGQKGSLSVQGSLAVSGDFIGEGIFQYVKKLSFFGNQPSNLRWQIGNLDTLELSKIPLVKTFLQGDSLHISNLQFSNEDNILFIKDTDLAISGDVTGYNENNFIQTNGKGLIERRLSNIPVIFPVGDDVKGFQPIFISTTTKVGSETAKVGYLLTLNSADNYPNRQPVWRIENNCPIQIHYDWGLQNNLNDGVFRLNDLRLKGWNGNEWMLIGFDSLIGNIKEGYLKTRILKPDEFQFYKLESVVFFNLNDIKKGKNIELLPAFPNPFSDGTSLNFKLKEESLVTIQLFSPNGQLIKEIQNKYLSGLHAEKLPDSLFQVSGNYLLIIKNDKDILQTQLLKISY